MAAARREMVHFFALMLWVAGVLAFVAGMPQLGVAIFVIIVVNAVFAFAQEQRAERASQRLLELLPATVLVRRDGAPLEVDAASIVVGDIVLLATGDRVRGRPGGGGGSRRGRGRVDAHRREPTGPGGAGRIDVGGHVHRRR